MRYVVEITTDEGVPYGAEVHSDTEIKTGEDHLGTLHDENGNPFEVYGVVTEILEETEY